MTHISSLLAGLYVTTGLGCPPLALLLALLYRDTFFLLILELTPRCRLSLNRVSKACGGG